MSTRKNDKRSRLVEAAERLFHEKGFNMTTLANIAELADVPLGNVYYYFKSKDSIAIAVLERMTRQFLDLAQSWEHAQNDSLGNLKAFIEYSVSQVEDRTQYGDALGSLCQELGKQGGALSEATSKLMTNILGWVEKQFNGLNKGEASEKLAANLIATLQGISLLTVTLKDADFLNRQSAMVVNWLENL